MTLRSAPGHWDLPPQETEAAEVDPFTIYELIHPLGRGSYGAVYKARVLDTGAIVAVKIIPLTEQDEISSIQKEIGMLRDCQHPNVVNYFGSWRTPDSLWIVMEYCAGGSVSDIMHACDATLDEDVIAFVCAETLAGLAYLHAVGKVHRDIKCGNILLTEGGEVKLADFGVAAQLTNTMSKRNTFIGTPHWMAPEVIQASHYDGKVDVWALGVSAIEMAERFPPRWKVNPNRVIFMVVKDPPPALADKERWSLTFQDYVAQCLQKDARVRPTAKYLQQHKFVTRDRGAALRRLLPMISQARSHMAEMAAAAALPSAAGPPDDGYFSWREGPGGTVAAAARPGGTYAGDTFLHQRGGGGGGGYQATVLAAGGPNMRASGDSQFGGLGGEASGTFVVRESLDGADFGGTMRSLGPPSSRASAGHGGGGGFEGSATLLMREEHREEGAPRAQGGGLAPAGGSDYLAAVQAVSDGHVELDVHGLPAQGARLVPAPAQGPETEAQRLVERLHNLYSGGAVVPLPFLAATDIAALSLLGIADGPLGQLGAGGEEEGLPGWEAALRDLVAESRGNAGGDGTGGEGGLPPAMVQMVLGSPVLFNLATSLAHHLRLLASTAQQAEGVSPAAREQLRLKAGDLQDTLRTILCL